MKSAAQLSRWSSWASAVPGKTHLSYWDAWKGTDEQRILAYYSDDVLIHLPTGTLEGKAAVRDSFVRPFYRRVSRRPDLSCGGRAGLDIVRYMAYFLPV